MLGYFTKSTILTTPHGATRTPSCKLCFQTLEENAYHFKSKAHLKDFYAYNDEVSLRGRLLKIIVQMQWVGTSSTMVDQFCSNQLQIGCERNIVAANKGSAAFNKKNTCKIQNDKCEDECRSKPMMLSPSIITKSSIHFEADRG